MSPRTHLTFIAAGAVVAALGVTAPQAHATPMGFVQQLNDAGISVYDAASALNSGYRICDALNHANGEQVARAVFESTTWAEVPDMNTARIWVLVSVRELCAWQDHSGQLVRA